MHIFCKTTRLLPSDQYKNSLLGEFFQTAQNQTALVVPKSRANNGWGKSTQMASLF